MKKKLSILLCSVLLLSLFPPTVFAVSAPTISDSTVYGNGVPLLIEAGDVSGTTVKYDGNSDGIFESTLTSNNASSLTVFGGVNGGSVTSASVTVTGGNISTLYGGSYGESGSGAGSVYVSVTGGSIGTLYSGGYTYSDSDTVTVARIDISGGTVGTLYGGGRSRYGYGYGGYSTVSDCAVNIRGGSITTFYATGSQAGRDCENTVANLGITVTGGTIVNIKKSAGASNNAVGNSANVTGFVICGGSIASSDLECTPMNGQTDPVPVEKSEIVLMDKSGAVQGGVALSGLSGDMSYSYGMKDVSSDSSGKVYLWLPASAAVTGADAVSGDTYVSSGAGILTLRKNMTQDVSVDAGTGTLTCTVNVGDCADSFMAIAVRYTEGRMTLCRFSGKYDPVEDADEDGNISVSFSDFYSDDGLLYKVIILDSSSSIPVCAAWRSE